MNWKKKENTHTVDVMFILLLFCVFAVSVLMVLLFGAKVYKTSNAVSNDNFLTRTNLLYLSNKVKQNDTLNGMEVVSFGDGDALVLKDVIDGYEYHTYLYRYQNTLRELYVEKGYEQDPEFGTVISDVNEFKIEQTDDGFIQIILKDQKNKENVLLIHQRSLTVERE